MQGMLADAVDRMGSPALAFKAATPGAARTVIRPGRRSGDLDARTDPAHQGPRLPLSDEDERRAAGQRVPRSENRSRCSGGVAICPLIQLAGGFIDIRPGGVPLRPSSQSRRGHRNVLSKPSGEHDHGALPLALIVTRPEELTAVCRPRCRPPCPPRVRPWLRHNPRSSVPSRRAPYPASIIVNPASATCRARRDLVGTWNTVSHDRDCVRRLLRRRPPQLSADSPKLAGLPRLQRSAGELLERR